VARKHHRRSHVHLQVDTLTKATAKMAVYGYARVSTLRQANEGESLDVQKRQIEGYVYMHGLALDEVVVEEGVSGSTPVSDRPEGGALFAKLKKGDIVISPKLDRLFRSALDALTVVEDMRMSMAPGFSSEVAPENSPVWRAGDQP
jgi:hypothetical protein